MKMLNGHAARDWDNDTELDETDGTEDRGKIIGEGIPSDPEITLENGTATVTVTTTDEQVSEDSFASPTQKRLRYWREVY